MCVIICEWWVCVFICVCVFSLYIIMCSCVCSEVQCMIVCVCVFVCMYSVCVLYGVYVCIIVWLGIWWIHGCLLCVFVYKVCVWLHVIAIQTRSDIPTQFGFVFAVEPIHWWFGDLPTRWSRDLSQFMQWRLDDDSGPKSCHFMLIFALVLFFYLPLSMAICILLVSFHVNVWFILPV